MVAVKDKPLMHFATQDAFAAFLEADPPDSGIRLQLVKKGDDRPGIDWQQAVDVALCYGWIDSQAAGTIDGYRVVTFTPRRRAQPVVADQHRAHRAAHRRGPDASGRPRGDRAREGGRPLGRRVPGEGRRTVARTPGRARRQPEGIRRLGDDDQAEPLRDHLPHHPGKKPETRTRKIEQYVAMLERGETIY